MTAGAGIIHDEFHSAAFRASGGVLEMVQLWVNLPAEHKLTTPGYQEIKSEQIPVVAMPGGAGRVRVIAGNYAKAALQQPIAQCRCGILLCMEVRRLRLRYLRAGT
ncbi:hypothetical protein ALON55S_02793 [Alishewanella longhuensis]